MAYKALYRAYRPRRFSELKGQSAIAEILKNQVRLGEPSHAYLFVGPRGTGKTSTAKILASALNCLNPQDGEPCLECENCLDALNDAMLDIMEIDAASNNGVDNAREIREKINLLPVKGKYKIYIIDEVHELTDSAFNALLKTLEEPPSYGIFILATTELHKLPKTILSRCQRFDFRHIDDSSIIERMKEVLADLGKTADEEALAQIAEAADGGLRDALTILDQCTILGEHIDMPVVLEVLNLTDRQSMLALLRALRDYDEALALSMLEQIVNSGVEPANLAAQLLQALRNVLRTAMTGEQGPYTEVAQGWDKGAIIRCLEGYAEAERAMRYSAKPAIQLEVATLKLLLPEAEQGAEPAQRMTKLERKVETLAAELAAGPQIPAPREKAPTQPAERKKKPVIQMSEDGGALLERLKEAFQKDAAASVFLDKLKIAGTEGGRLIVTADSASTLRMLEESTIKGAIEEKAQELTGRSMALEIVMPEDERRILELYSNENIDIIYDE